MTSQALFHLFPFGKVSPGQRIAIYGGGEIGESYRDQVKVTGFCHLVCVTDRRYDKSFQQHGIAHVPVTQLTEQQVDVIVIASEKFSDDICATLASMPQLSAKVIPYPSKHQFGGIAAAPTPDIFNWDNYYYEAEAVAQKQFEQHIAPLLDKWEANINLKNVIDFACGHGRIAQIMAPRCGSLTCLDINADSIAFCQQRFQNYDNVNCKRNAQDALPVSSETIDFVYSWDAMVHFSFPDIKIYIKEFARVLKPGGYVLMHHANLAALAGVVVHEDWRENPHYRSKVSNQHIRTSAEEAGLRVVEQHTIAWEINDLDGITLLQKA